MKMIKKRRGVTLCTNVYSVVIAFILCEYIFLDVRFVWLSVNKFGFVKL